MTPIFTSPCDLAERIPAMAADFLELETKIGRRFREDSVTDIIIASLLKIGGEDATVFTPPEALTGGDFDLVIFQPATGDSVQYRIQSKRLVPNPTNWLRGSYRELDHPHGTGKQASTLIRSSAQEKLPTIPLYAFYNPLGACDASQGEISGIQLADGRQINAIVRALVKAKAKGKRPRWKRVEYLRHLFFPLSTILCPTENSPPDLSLIIAPAASRRAVVAAIAERQIAQPDIEDAPPQLEFKSAEIARLSPPERKAGRANLPSLVRASKRGNVSEVVERAINRQPDEPAIQRARIKRPKLVLLSR
ncbi:MAG: hypothetical protein J0H81_13175 [Sphingopyxis terrae]|jgi:hypothetical protein|uniref:DUF6615 family protein n=1 Tax=uncultured Sphingopyxis sp. TaxID=310581 RepID=UPI000A5899B3|nr:DUF6615 family protein [uncultured Sphingopyxis sp.]MBN8806007.1 hypothetical protein [Sphingopyxis terrae]